MILTLYKTDDADNVINKTLTNPTTMTIRLKAGVDIIRPQLLLSSVGGLDFRQFNYCEIDLLNRKYFIRSVEAVSQKLFKLICEVDVLETYKADIMASSGKVQKKIAPGDYGMVDLDYTGEVVVSNYTSNVELLPADNSLFSVLRWG